MLSLYAVTTAGRSSTPSWAGQMVLLRKMLELDRDAATLDIARRSQMRFLILGAPRVHMARRRF